MLALSRPLTAAALFVCAQVAASGKAPRNSVAASERFSDDEASSRIGGTDMFDELSIRSGSILAL